MFSKDQVRTLSFTIFSAEKIGESKKTNNRSRYCLNYRNIS